MGWKRLQNAVNSNDLRNASDRYCTWGYHLWDTADPGSLPLRPARDCGRPTSQTMRPGMSDCSSYRRRCGWIASRREQRSSPTNPQPTLSSKHPEPASVYTNQASAKSNKSHMPATGGCRHLLHVRSWSRAHLHSRAHIHWHAHGHGHIHSRVCAHPWCKPARRDQRPACTNQAPIQLTQMPCGCVTSPRIYASNRPTQNTWGAWVRHRLAMRRRRRRRRDVSTSGGASTCVSPA